MPRKKVSLREIDEENEEVESLVRETGGRSGVLRQPSGSGSSGFIWKLLAFLLLCVSLLFATDTIEIDQLKGKGRGKGLQLVDTVKSKTSSITGSVASKTSDTDTGSVSTAGTDSGSDSGSDADSGTDSGKDAASESGSDSSPEPAPGSRYTYTRRGQPMDDSTREALAQKWGKWSWDDEPARPNQDALYDKHPHRDVPADAWPQNAWQRDTKYLERYLKESLALVDRTQEAILAEYGHGKDDEPGKSFEERSAMFSLTHKESLDDLNSKTPAGDKGGWTTPSSWKGLKRRIQHALMTEDSFVFSMGGHSSSAGHGNHFSQSYTLQVAWIMESVFARLGVKHESRNFGNGGLGTAHNGLAAGSMYGPDVSFIMWDSGMTEREGYAHDVFARQALIGGNKVPVLWNFPNGVLRSHLNSFGADVGAMGSSKSGIPLATNLEEVNAAIWAARYVNCNGEMYKSHCRPNEYNGTCWIPRDDYTPTTKQEAYPGGRASWHPGNRFHQLNGRTLAFTILMAMREVLTDWQARENYIVPDEEWHVGNYYESIRSKVLAGTSGGCFELGSKFNLPYFCKYPFQARTVFSPRAHSRLSSIATLMAPEMDVIVPDDQPSVYNPPDVFNPRLHPPPGEIDVLSIVEGGPDFRPIVSPSVEDHYRPAEPKPAMVTPGKGYGFRGKIGNCDGTLYSFCGRTVRDTCLLRGHNDDRGGYSMDSLSGWMVLNVPRVKNGYIAIKLQTWHGADSNGNTAGWTTINGEGDEDKNRQLSQYEFQNQHRSLKGQPPKMCDDLKFEVALDGKVTMSLNKDQFLAKKKLVQRVVEILPVLEDPNFTGGVEKDVQVAFRMVGCGRNNVFTFNHIYWS